MKIYLKRLPILLLGASLLTFSSHAMDAVKATAAEVVQEQQAVQAMTVSNAPAGPNQRHRISEAHILKPTLAIIAKMKADPTYIPSKDERKILFICNAVFTNARNTLPATVNLPENTNIIFKKNGAKTFLTANVAVDYDEVQWAIKQVMERLTPSLTPEIFDEEVALIKAMTVSNAPAAPTQRHRISESHVLKPTLALIAKMKTDPSYIPSKNERKTLFICYDVFTKAMQTLPTTTNLPENTNLIFKKNGAKTFLTANVAVDYDDVKWAMDHLKSLAEKNKAPGAPVDQPLDWVKWNETLTMMANAYFSLPYKDAGKFPSSDAKTSRIVGGKPMTVHRPNHALAHAMRTGFIAVDILDTYAKSDPKSFQDPNTQGIAEFIQDNLKYDPYFREKVEMAAVYQRTGRQSEITGKESADAKTAYVSYVETDAANFYNDVTSTPDLTRLFTSEEEVKAYMGAIHPGSVNEATLSPYHKQLKTIVRILIFTGHMIDLKRLANTGDYEFPQNGVKGSGAINMGFKILVNKNGNDDWAHWTFEANPSLQTEQKFLDKIWNREEAYLVATGDRPLTSGHYEDKFFIQSQNPLELIHALIDARKLMESQGK